MSSPLFARMKCCVCGVVKARGEFAPGAQSFQLHKRRKTCVDCVRALETATTITCTVCGEDKARCEFQTSTSCPGGVRRTCKACIFASRPPKTRNERDEVKRARSERMRAMSEKWWATRDAEATECVLCGARVEHAAKAAHLMACSGREATAENVREGFRKPRGAA